MRSQLSRRRVLALVLAFAIASGGEEATGLLMPFRRQERRHAFFHHTLVAVTLDHLKTVLDGSR